MKEEGSKDGTGKQKMESSATKYLIAEVQTKKRARKCKICKTTLFQKKKSLLATIEHDKESIGSIGGEEAFRRNTAEAPKVTLG